MAQVKPSVTLLEYTPNPERTIALAAKLCYSDATIANLKEGLDDENAAKFIARLRSFGHASPFESSRADYQTQNSFFQRQVPKIRGRQQSWYYF